MAVQFNGQQCGSPQPGAKKAQFGCTPQAKAKFGAAPNYAQRAGAPGQVQFGIVDGGIVSGPCSCVACCCAPLLLIPAAVITFFLGRKLFRGLGSAGRGLGSGISGLTNRFKKGAKQADAAAE